MSFTSLHANNVPARDEQNTVPDEKDTPSDPYIRIALLDDDGEVVDDERTKFVHNEYNPTWKETLTMPVPARITYPPRILIELWDKDWLQDDELIGSAKVRLEPSALGRGQLQKYRLNVVSANGERANNGDADEQLADGQELTIGLFFNFTPELYYEEASRESAVQPWERAPECGL